MLYLNSEIKLNGKDQNGITYAFSLFPNPHSEIIEYYV